MSESAAPAVSAQDIKPVTDRVLVRRVKKTDRTSGGIHLPDQSRDVSQVGRIVALHPSAVRATGLGPGDWVFFSGYAAPVVATNDYRDDLVMIRYQDILGTVDFAVPATNGQMEAP